MSLDLSLEAAPASGDKIALSWTGGSGIKLQKTTNLTSRSWQDVPGSDGVSQIELPRVDPVAFFRLIQR